MGYLLKEGLKTLCGVKQWDYAVFWKIGCQNPTLLIWEECYHALVSTSSLAGISGTHQLPQAELLAEDKVASLINKMILADRVKIVGQGLVGRAAFTGNHFWILSEGYGKVTHPPEVQNEICGQFFAGIKTLVVIPIFTHGVVQFGSSSDIMENMAFVNDVKNLILQVGCVPGAFLSDNYNTRVPASEFDIPPFQNESFLSHPYGNCKPTDHLHRQSAISHPSELNHLSHSTVGHLRTNPHINIVKSQDDSSLINAVSIEKCSLPLGSQFNGESNLEMWQNQQTFLQNQWSGSDGQPCAGPSSMNYGTLGIGGAGIFSDSFLQDCVSNSTTLSESLISQFATSEGFSSSPFPLHGEVSDGLLRSLINPTLDTTYSKEKVENGLIENTSGFDHFIQKNMFGNQSSEPGSSGEDLFDVLGSDFKRKLFSNFTPDYHQYADSGVFSAREGELDGIFPSGSDHLLDAVVSKVPYSSMQKLDIGISSGTTLTNVSSSSVDNASFSLGNLARIRSVPFKSEKEDIGNYSQTSSLYGSQVSSWVDQGQPSGKQNSGGSKKGDEISNKSNRKRLKPGESPRPRPKDRQMIQDRMKELRELVPNGAKLSIDALLERTIKHMLFLQSVAKHADKLKETGESKIIDQEGGLVLRDGFEGGRTWACEVGSQNMVCPILVEDLNAPRQMLIEMLCEERGLFLEIADIVRGLGLNILKGVMETRNNKIWARFVVEANEKLENMLAVNHPTSLLEHIPILVHIQMADRDVTRMEIFLSLVHLLEQTIESIPSASCNGINTNIMSPSNGLYTSNC